MPLVFTHWNDDWNTVRDAGWAYDHGTRRWGHSDGRWTELRQAALARCIRNGDPIPTVQSPLNVLAMREGVYRAMQAGHARYASREAPGKLFPISNPQWEA